MINISGGIEIETAGVSVSRTAQGLNDHGIRGCRVVPDGSPNVDAEIVLPPIGVGQAGKEYLQSVCRALDDIGCRINVDCGLHVHVGNAPISGDINAFTGDSIAYSHNNTGQYLSRHGETFDFVIIKDLFHRYERQQSAINTMFPTSRTNNRYCMPLNGQKIDRANNISQLNHGKFFAINLETWSRGTVEFRQHSGTTDAEKIYAWLEFLQNFVQHTVHNRVETGSRTIVQETPENPFRRGARVGVQYTMMRSPNGATTREIMDATGCSEQRVRAAVSEIRDRVGDAAVVTHTQQSNGASYGSGTDHTRYQVIDRVETQQDGVGLMPENRIGIPSIWASLSDALYEWWQNRIDSLR